MYGSAQSAYNPFDLYGQARAGRNNPLPPHLVFAELGDDEAAACAYLNAYGPLQPEYTDPNQQTCAEWRKLSGKSPEPPTYFRNSLNIDAMLPPRPHRGIAFHAVSLERFWRLQSEYELTVRLVSAVFIRRAFAIAEVRCDARNDRELIEEATEHVKPTINRYLDRMSPRIVRTPNRRSIEGFWACYSLLQALYLMLFLDIASRGVRIVSCEKCTRLFYADRERVMYCSPMCENRARALRAYHKKGAS